MKIINHKSNILDPKPTEQGFNVRKYSDPLIYAAAPVAGSTTKLAIIHQGNIIKYCRNRKSAINYINKHKKK